MSIGVSNFLVIGRVSEIVEDREAKLVVIQKDDRTVIACRFWGKSTKYLEGMGQGDLVEINGYLTSRKSPKGFWNNDLNASFAKVHSRAQGPGPDRTEDGSGLPF